MERSRISHPGGRACRTARRPESTRSASPTPERRGVTTRRVLHLTRWRSRSYDRSNDRTVRRSAMARGKKTGGGSRRGIPNRATASAREALGMLVDANVGDLQSWLNEIKRKEGARAAWECFMSLVEFSVPKLMRSELRVGPAAIADPFVVDDAVEAANIYERIMRGDLAIEAVRFEPTSEPGV